MSGVRVQEARFDVGAELAALLAGRTDIGGVGCFVGIVRGGAGDALTLEHYPGMTETALAGIVADAERRFALLGCTVVHRVGRLAAGEPIVLVLAASTHRGPALQAIEFLIDWLKVHAPFWKYEERDGAGAWVEARAADDVAAQRWNA